MNPRASFTLIELLIVLGIVAVLSVVVIVVLNPAQMLKQARDSNRLADMNTLNRSLSLFDTDVTGGFFGTSSVLYVSVPDPAATSSLGSNCSGLGLSTTSLPAGWSYRCAASSTVRKTDGTGWIPVNFDQMSFRALAALPVDPVNATSSNLYYTYAAGGSWEITSLLESEKHQAKQVTDAGYDPGMYEVGNDLALSPFARGLRGYWKMDGTGTTASDSSGLGNHASIYSSSSLTDLHTSASFCKGGCVLLDGINDNLEVAPNARLDITGGLTISAWVYHTIPTSTPEVHWGVLSKGNDGAGYNYSLLISTQKRILYTAFTGAAWVVVPSQTTVTSYQVHHLALTQSNGKVRFYLDGALDRVVDAAAGASLTGAPIHMGGNINQNNDTWLPGYLDEVRLYGRALSDTEIRNLYNDR